MTAERAPSNALLELNDDCLYCIFKKLTIKDQLQLVNTCERFRTIIRQMIWRCQFQKLRTIDSNTNELNNQEYQEFFHHVVEYLEEFIIADNKHLVFSSYLGRYSHRPELTFYLCSQFPRLRCFECLDGRLHDGLMRLISTNFPKLQVLKVTGDHITGAHIKDMSNLRELYLPGCSLRREHLRDISKHLNITHLDVSDCDLVLPIEEHNWCKLRSLKISENQLIFDFVEKLRYLRSLENLIVKLVYTENSSPDWIGLFESFGSNITCMNLLLQHDSTFVPPSFAFASSIHKLTALRKIVAKSATISDMQVFAQLPALKEFHEFTYQQRGVNNIVNFIAQAKHLVFFELICVEDLFDYDFSWLLEVIRILRQEKGRPKLCLNLFHPMHPNKYVEIRNLVMEEQQNSKQPLLEVTFNRPALLKTFKNNCREDLIELCFDKRLC